MDGGERPGVLAAFVPLAAELGDLKRIRDASSPDSLAVRAFRRAWAWLVAGQDVQDAALSVSADALAALRLGGIDLAMLHAIGVRDARAVLERSFDEAGGAVPHRMRARLRQSLGGAVHHAAVPAFVEALIRQPRAGATCPGKPRLVLEPPENHGDHCLVVAVLGVLLAERFDADPAMVFLAGLAHHLHNAVLPDSGFAGETLLGDELGPVMTRLFDRALDELPGGLAQAARGALSAIAGADTPEGRAFHAADVMDRVLQMRHYDEVARFTTAQALDDFDLVHAGPVQAFHRDVLREAGLP